MSGPTVKLVFGLIEKIPIRWSALQKFVATRVLVLVKCKVCCQAHICHKLAQDLLRRAHKHIQNSHSTTLSVHVYNLNVTPVDGGLKLLQHVGINFILTETSLIRSLIVLALKECFGAKSFKIASLLVIIAAASLSKGETDPACKNIVYDIANDIRYDI
jgi:hypothetical protein